MMKNENLKDKLAVTRSKSTSNILKQKIGIAFGRQKNQSLQKYTNKKTTLKCASTSSYLGKQRSMSMKSLARTTALNNQIEKLQVTTIKRKFSFCDHQSSSCRQKKQQAKSNEPFLSSRTSRTEKTKANDSQHNINNSYSNLIWLDCSNACNKLKIVSKSSITLGENLPKSSIEYMVDNDTKSFILFRVQQSKLTVIQKKNLLLILYDEKFKKKQCFSGDKLNRVFSLNFDGYVFSCKLNQQTDMENSIEKFNFLYQQIQRLNEDGLKDFSIIQKIVKRMFESRFSQNKVKNELFCLLMKVQKISSLQKQDLAYSHKNAEQLLAKKLLIDKSTLPSNNLATLSQQSMKKKFTTDQ